MRVLRELEERSFVLKGNVPFDRFERERAVHGAALKIDVAQLACQPRGNSALACAGRAVNGDDELAG